MPFQVFRSGLLQKHEKALVFNVFHVFGGYGWAGFDDAAGVRLRTESTGPEKPEKPDKPMPFQVFGEPQT